MNHGICHGIIYKIVPTAVINRNFYALFLAAGDQLFKIRDGEATVLIIGKLFHIITARNIHTAFQAGCRVYQPVFQLQFFLPDAVLADPVASPAAHGSHRHFIRLAEADDLIQMR